MYRYSICVCLAVAMMLTILNLSARSEADDQVSANQASAGDAKPVIVEDSMHEFMEYVFQPTYRRLKESMAEAPEDNRGWKAVKSDALILAESCNLLFSRSPDEQAADWARYSAESRDAGAALYHAAREKDFQTATASWTKMLDRCNACHRQFEDGKHILAP